MAQYAEQILAQSDGDIILSVSGTGFVLEAGADTVQAAGLFAVAAGEGKRLTFSLPSGRVALDAGVVSSLAGKDVSSVSLTGDAQSGVVLRFRDSSGLTVAPDGDGIRLTVGKIAGTGAMEHHYTGWKGARPLHESLCLWRGGRFPVSPERERWNFLLLPIRFTGSGGATRFRRKAGRAAR